MIQYADDTILLMPACQEQIKFMKQLLLDYADSIGLKLNFQKSLLIPINVDDDMVNQLAHLWECTVGKMPFTYLGLPMGTTKPSVTDLMPLVERTERRLSSSLCMLDHGSKLTLLNSLITSMMIYPMCTLKFPPKLIEHLDKIRRHCLWRKKTDQGEKANSLAAWNLVCRPKKNGGLGILDIKTQNTALLLKFLHSFYNKHGIPWVHLIWNTYYNNKVPHATDACGLSGGKMS